MIVAEEAAKIESKEAAKRMAEITAGKGYLAQKKCYISKVPEGSPSSWQGKELGEVFKTAGGDSGMSNKGKQLMNLIIYMKNVVFMMTLQDKKQLFLNQLNGIKEPLISIMEVK